MKRSMEGMLESLINYLDKYSSQMLFLQLGFIFIFLAVILWVYYYNRRKYHHLKHQIPAAVVKSYLDSIIQNSTALKSSLFRGGGLDIDSSAVPSVFPLQHLPSSSSLSAPASDSNQSSGQTALLAQIASLQSQLSNSELKTRELETQSIALKGEVKNRDERIIELEKMLESLKNSKPGQVVAQDPALAAKLSQTEKERDKLKEKLAQYEILEDDLANLKSLKDENQKLREQLGMGVGAVDIPYEEPISDSLPELQEEPVVEELAEIDNLIDQNDIDALADSIADIGEGLEEDITQVEAKEDDPIADALPQTPDEAPRTKESNSSSDDLLSEFEKMLG